MINEDIHNGLDKKEIRDFLAKQSRTLHMPSEYIEEEIKKLQEELVKAKTTEAARQLIKICGWEIYDVDELVPYDKKTYFEFIGTKEEFEKVFGKEP